jgi:tRNA A-37 threonylcarbamoyl transferase component Bud32
MQTMSPQLPAGMVLGDTYRIVRLIGRGGMGDVYEATHARLAGRYALKVLAAGGMDSEDLVRRFRREAEVTSGLRHPNVVQVVDFNTTPDRRPYLVMEYLEGTELTAEIKRAGAMPIPRALDLIGQIASALAAAHDQRIVHRDLKPQNLFLVPVPGEEREIVKVVDFGISKVREATTQLTQDTAVMGTPQYMAPEQAQGRISEIDGRTDQFALGAIAYELLAGQAAFRGGTIPSLLYQVVHEQPEPLRGFNPRVPPELEAVILRAMAKRREDRYPTVRDFHRELLSAGRATAPRGLAIQMTEPALAVPSPQLPRWIDQPELPLTTFGNSNGQVHLARPGRGKGALLGVALVALAVAGGGLLWFRAPSRPLSVTTVDAIAVPAATVGIQLLDAPAALRVQIDGVYASLPLEVPRGGRHRVVFTAPQYQPLAMELDGSEAQIVSLRKMVRETPPEAAPAPVPAARPAPHRAPPAHARKPEKTSAPPPPRTAPPAERPDPPAAKRSRPITDL